MDEGSDKHLRYIWRKQRLQPSNWNLNTRHLYPGLSCTKLYNTEGRWTVMISRDIDRIHKIVYLQVQGTPCGLSKPLTIQLGIQQQPHLTTFPCSCSLLNNKWHHSYEKIDIPNAQQEARWASGTTGLLPVHMEHETWLYSSLCP